MKRTLTIASLALFAMIGQAAPITTITNYFPGYVAVTSGWQTVSESGLSTNTAYVCIPLSSLPALTAAQAVATGAGSDVRMLLYAINDAAYTQYTAAPSTNRPANASISRSSSSASITNYATTHSLRTTWTLTTPTITPE